MFTSTMNIHQFVGRLTADPELKQVSEEKQVLTFRLAYNTRRTTDAEGSHSNFIDCELWGKAAASYATLLSKGLQVIVKGELLQRRWKAADGTNRSRFTISVDRIEICDLKKRPVVEDFKTAASA
ncbi:MAG: single-stranded DNA-binding protein [Candidatus Hydrogenedentota bacterium]|nr:MAG: single-stranded DNA-binding protein [Candidatus Hydrogenedentota bacterium]